MRRLLALPLLLPLACGSSSSHPDAGPVDAGDPAARLGLTQGTCYEYSAGESMASPADLGAAVESTSATAIEYLPDGGSATVQALQLVYRHTGLKAMSDYLRFEGSTLFLLKREVNGAETVEYKPAAPLLRLPFKNLDHVDFTGKVNVFQGSSQTRDGDYALAFDVLTDSATTPKGSFDTFKVTYTETVNGNPANPRLTGWDWKEGEGPVVLSGAMAQGAGDGGLVPLTYKLQNTRTLSGASDLCGSH